VGLDFSGAALCEVRERDECVLAYFLAVVARLGEEVL
jgi:hypothetical protein